MEKYFKSVKLFWQDVVKFLMFILKEIDSSAMKKEKMYRQGMLIRKIKTDENPG